MEKYVKDVELPAQGGGGGGGWMDEVDSKDGEDWLY